MRKLLLLFVLFPFTVFAKYYPSTIFMIDGNVKVGFLEVPSEGRKQTLKFKILEKGSSEKLNISDIKGFEYNDGDNGKINCIVANYLELNYAYGNKVKKAWFRVVKEGSISLYTLDGHSGMPVSIGFSVGYEKTLSYYIRKRDQDCAYYLGKEYEYMEGAGWFKRIKSEVESIFKDDCPNLVNSLDKDDLKKDGLIRIVDLYEQNCGVN